MGGVLLFIAWVDFTFIAMAAGFGAVVAHGGSPVTPEQFGAQVYAIPALAWVGAQTYAGVIGLAGAIVAAQGGRWHRIGAAISATGNTALACLFALFAMLSDSEGQGALLHYASMFPGLGITAASAVLTARYAWWGENA